MENNLRTYCISCRVGSEKIVVNGINKILGSEVAYAPMRILQEKKQGIWGIKERILVPGYIFTYLKGNESISEVRKISGTYRVLEYQLGYRELTGTDYEYASWIYKHQGRIGPSKAILEGETVKVIEGPLLDQVGTIKWVDKHNRRATVEFTFNSRIQKVSLSVTYLNTL